MKKSICLYFQVHQPTRLRLYRFFDIGKDSHYYDDYSNRIILNRIAKQCYLPMNELLLQAIEAGKGDFRLTFSISGSALEQFDRYCPEVIESFRKLAETGCVEFLSETYYHTLASLISEGAFKHQVEMHTKALETYLGVKRPKAFRNTELIYSDSIGAMVREMGYTTMLTEGARHIMGWKNPNYLYNNDLVGDLKLLLRNYSLSDDIAFRFSDTGWNEWPVTAEKFAGWINDSQGEIFNIFMDYETFGEHQPQSSGIFDFMRALPEIALKSGLVFQTASESSETHKSVGDLSVPEPISWADEERDTSASLGNELQQDAFRKLYGLDEKLSILNDNTLWYDFGRLQESDHFYYMCTKFFTDGEIHKRFNPYDTPYEAFINYMNVLSDFIIRVNNAIAER